METHRDPESHIAEAKASFTSHVAELGRRFHEARTKLDVRAHIAAHPLTAVGIAFGLGALLAMGRGRRDVPRDAVHDKRGLAAAALAAGGALAMRFAKDFALGEALELAKQWWEGRSSAGSTEVQTSNDPSVEAFLEH